MKNPFKKEDHTTLIVAATIVGVAASAIAAYLLLTENGNNVRKSLKKKIKAIAKGAAADAVSKHTKIPKKAAKAVADHVIK